MAEFTSKDLGDGFGWDEQQVPENFFNDSPEDLENKTSADAVIKELENDDPNEGENKKTDEELADELFSDEVGGDNEVGRDDEVGEYDEDTEAGNENKEHTGKKAKTVTESKMVSAVNILKDKGIIDFELDDGEELTDELADELIEDKFDEAIDDRVKELFEGMPDVVKQLVKYTKDGGDPNEFLATILKNSSTGIVENMDLSSESNQETVIRNTLKSEGYDDDYIDTQIDFLKDTGKLESVSKQKYKVWSDKKTKENEQLVKIQENKKIQDKEKARQEKAKLSTTLSSVDDVSGIKLTSKDKKELPNYMLDKSYTLGNGTSITSFQKDVWEAMSNETTALQLAKLLRDRKKDGSFDFSKLENIAKTKVVKEIKDNIQRNKDITPHRSVGKIGSQKSLADYF